MKIKEIIEAIKCASDEELRTILMFVCSLL
jgi:hypothetical protein